MKYSGDISYPMELRKRNALGHNTKDLQEILKSWIKPLDTSCYSPEYAEECRQLYMKELIKRI